ncbi:hypothetical protein GC177_03190 [bacterium]|nr:hypothetical protein [bacterium]
MTNSYNPAMEGDGLTLAPDSPTAAIGKVVHWRAIHDINLLELHASEAFAAIMVPYMERFNALMHSERPMHDLENLAAEIGETLAGKLNFISAEDAKILGPIYKDWSIRIQRQHCYEDGHSGPHFFGLEVCRTFYATLRTMKQDNRLQELGDTHETGVEKAVHILESLDAVDIDTEKQLNRLFKA